MSGGGASAAGCARCGFDSAVDGGPVPCPRCEAVAVGKYCGSCGAELENGHVARRAMRSLFEPVAEYIEHARSLVRPSHLIHEIRERRFTVVELIGFWVAAILIGSLVMTVLPIKHAEGEHFAPPILTEAIQAIGVMVLVTICYAPLHLMLRIKRRDVTIRHFLMTMLTVMALVFPWLALFEGIVFALRLPGDPNNWGWIVLMPVMAMSLAELYHRHVAIVVATIIGYFTLLFAILFALVLVAALVAHKPIGASDKPGATAAGRT
ncbi:hypothetical protein [Sphingomonas sp.]|uniref:hypothetical protein n=1 Tax=Sphingomonas sp. TaxID=28214 RepID=UPI002E332F3D|nr:hypothetical protein [Sphingomonas sp.]HEX4693382.1 hypothetical protein [Sphingomonas sp.]